MLKEDIVGKKAKDHIKLYRLVKFHRKYRSNFTVKFFVSIHLLRPARENNSLFT